MPHILRDAVGKIIAVVDHACPGPTEEIAPDHPEFLAFIGRTASADDPSTQADFSRADLEFIRVLEDLIVALISKGHLALNDLPLEAQRKLLDRTAMRARITTYEITEEDAEFLV